MLILSQDRTEITELSRMYIFENKSMHNYSIFCDCNNFGEYKTEERAKHILAEIMTRAEMKREIYIMPEE